MKKLIFIILFYVLICFAIPIIFTKRYKAEEIKRKKVEQEEKKTSTSFDYKKFNNIKLVHKKTGEIEELPLDEYLYGVVSAEMPANFELEALKAQAVVARTYTIYKLIHGSKHEEANICDEASCCQAWISKEDRLAKWNEEERQANWEKIVFAVEETKGKIITHNNEPINAFFHSNSGGTTEIPSNVWGGNKYPYLQVVSTAGEDAYSQYSSEASFTKDELLEKLKQYHQNVEIDFKNEDDIRILENTESGRVKTIKFGNIEISGTEARTIFGLKSAMFTIDKTEEKINFKVIGYGHGVGMSQTGADSLAKKR